jgi:hypothetical protein
MTQKHKALDCSIMKLPKEAVRMKERKFKKNDTVYLRTEAVRGKLVKGVVKGSFKRAGYYCTGIRWEHTLYSVQWEISPYPTDWFIDNLITLQEAKKILKKREAALKTYHESDDYKNAPWRKVLEAKEAKNVQEKNRK